jgi:MFS superfamily sulfate permease-like transporter
MSRLRRTASETSGAFGDLGTLLPHVVGALTVAGMAPAGVLFGFGAFLIASGLFYAIPMAVQPMKAVSAIMLTGELDAAEVAATGLVIGLVLLVLGLTGSIGWLSRLIPKSVTAGLQLGLGLSLVLLGLDLIMENARLGGLVLAVLLGLLVLRALAATPLVLLAAVVLGLATGISAPPEAVSGGFALPDMVLPTVPDVLRAIELAVIPQLPLTLTNAVIVAAIVARELFPTAASRAGERNLAVSTGLGNVLLAPLGAMPMCHGAGGIQAQYRFGARTGAAPVILGVLLLVLALFFSGSAAALLGAIPLAAVGALLVIAGGDLALSRRLFDARPACWPAMGAAAALTLFVNPAAGLAAGWGIELVRTLTTRYVSARNWTC